MAGKMRDVFKKKYPDAYEFVEKGFKDFLEEAGYELENEYGIEESNVDTFIEEIVNDVLLTFTRE